MAEGKRDLAPNWVRLWRACMARTTPIADPASATSGNDFEPISSSWRTSSRPSKGGEQAEPATFHAKIPRLPNHSKKSLASSPKGVRIGTLRSANGGLNVGDANPRSLTRLVPWHQRARRRDLSHRK